MKDTTALMVAYNKVLREARHLMASHRRLDMVMGVAKQDADKLQAAIDHAARLEQEVADATRAHREDESHA